MNTTFLGYPLDTLTLDETAACICRRAAAGSGGHHVSLNAGKIVLASDDDKLAEVIRHADMASADGMSVVWAARALGERVPERVAGIDLMGLTLECAEKEGIPVYFFGATQEVLDKFVHVVRDKHPKLIVAGYENGYAQDMGGVAERVRDSGARLLYVAISSPKKEFFVDEQRALLSETYVIGVGGSFDVWAGLTKRAPLWMQRTGLEWFYRFAQEPRRMWRRYLVGNSRFFWIVLKARLGRG